MSEQQRFTPAHVRNVISCQKENLALRNISKKAACMWKLNARA